MDERECTARTGRAGPADTAFGGIGRGGPAPGAAGVGAPSERACGGARTRPRARGSRRAPCLRGAGPWLLVALALLIGCDGGAPFSHPAELELRFDLANKRELGQGVIEYELRARLVNHGPRLDAATAVVTAPGPATEVVDGTFRFGPVGPRAKVAGEGAVRLRHDAAFPLGPEDLHWVLAGFGPSDRVEREVLETGEQRFVYALRWTARGGAGGQHLARLRSTGDPVLSDDESRAVPEPGNTVRTTDTWSFGLPPGADFDPTEVHIDLARDTGAPGGAALGITRTLDGSGHPLGGVRIEEWSGEPGAAPPRVLESEAGSGTATLGGEPGLHVWRFEREGHFPAWRRLALVSGRVLRVPSPWLARRPEATAELSVLTGGVLESEDGSVRLAFDGGAFRDRTRGAVTVLGPQALPAPLPLGYSPLAAFWVELGEPASAPATGTVQLSDAGRPGERLVMVELDPSAGAWRVLAEAVGDGGAVLAVEVPGAGAFAVVAADEGSAPGGGEPEVGALLLPAAESLPALPEEGLLAEGDVEPPSRPATTDPLAATGAARAALSPAPGGPPLPSGFPVLAEIAERYELADGHTVEPPPYEISLVAFRRPGGEGGGVAIHFPLRPSELFEPSALRRASVSAGLRPFTAFDGVVVPAAGGSVRDGEVEVLFAAADLRGPVPVGLRSVPVAGLGLPGGAPAATAAFDLEVEGLAEGASPRLRLPPVAPGADFVLARLVSPGGEPGLEPRLRMRSDGAGNLASVEPASGDRLPGIGVSGRYVLLAVDGPRGLVAGDVRRSTGAGAGGVAVEVPGTPWRTASDAAGGFRLIAPAGSGEVRAREAAGGDEGSSAFALPDAASVARVVISLAPAGPRVVSTDPADGSDGVPPVASIAVRFSEAVEPASLGSTGLFDAAGERVPASVGLDLAGTGLTVLPAEPLAPGERYELRIDPALRGGDGLPVEGDTTFSFTTAAAPVRRAGAQLVSFEPGAPIRDCSRVPGLGAQAPVETCDCSSVPGFDPADASISCVLGTPGTADPDVPVVLVNQSTGETATVRSGPDGSFQGFVRASVDDFLSAVFVAANGSRLEVPLSRQIFGNGEVALFRGGGILEAENEEAGVVQILVEPGTIPEKTRFAFDTVSAVELEALLGGQQPEGGRVLGGYRLGMAGDEPAESPELRFPVDPDALGLPSGADPFEASFALTRPVEFEDGVAFEVVDNLELEVDDEGNPVLATHSFPFLGMVAAVAASHGAAATVLFTPVLLAAGHSITVTGKVMASVLGPDGMSPLLQGSPPQPAVEPIPLPGAFVTLDTSMTFQSGRRGRIRPGAVYASARENGFYAFKVPDNRFDTDTVLLSALHPSLPGVKGRAILQATSLAESFLAVNVFPKNIYLALNPAGTLFAANDKLPPQVVASHEPLRPAPGTTAEVTLVATDNASEPQIVAGIGVLESLVPGQPVAPADVDLQVLGPDELPTPRSRRRRIAVTSTRAARVVLALQVSDGSGNTRTARYSIDFGGSDPPQPGAASADPHNEAGPQVLESSPPEGAEGVAPGEPVVLRFSTTLGPDVLQDTSWTSIDPPVGAPTVELAPDGRSVALRYYGLVPDTTYTVTVDSTLRDLNGNGFDQDPRTSAAEAYQLSFRTAPAPEGQLPGMENGGGAVVHGIHAFVLERRGALDGSLVSFDLSDPSSPQRIGELSVPGFPRDLALVPDFSFQREPGATVSEQPDPGAVETRDLVAVVGGAVTGAGPGFQYLWVVDVSEPSQPRRVASAVVSQSTTAVVPKVVWDPPYLVFLEFQADQSAIHYVNLQKFIYGTNSPEEVFPQFPDGGTEGLDLNGDGDYVDPGELLPLPARKPPLFVGWDPFRVRSVETTRRQRIIDFDATGGGFFLGVLLAAGVDTSTVPPTALPPSYRTFEYGGLGLPPQVAEVPLPREPKRVVHLGPTALRDPTGAEVVEDLVLVSLPGVGGGPGEVRILKVTDPLAPGQVGNPIEIPAVHGIVQSARRAEDGMVELATSRDLLLLDPAKFTADPAADGAGDAHPALVGLVAEAGSGTRTPAGDLGGIRVVNLGGRHRVVQSPPRLRLLSFPQDAPVDPSTLVDAGADALGARFARAAPEVALQPARVASSAIVPSSLQPPDPAVHYYVRVDAPGSAGPSISLLVESLDRSGRPLRSKGLLFPPVRAASDLVQSQLGQTALPEEPQVEPLEAFRLSSDPTDPYYNVYLSRPIALVYEELSVARLNQIRQELERAVIWSGASLRVSIDPTEAGTTAIGAFASRVDPLAREVVPGTHTRARSLPADLIMGPNPTPIVGGVEAPQLLGGVAAHNGEMRHTVTDFVLRGRKMHLVLKRRVTSQNLFVGAFGRGWDHNFNQRLLHLEKSVFKPGQSMPLVVRQAVADSEVAGSGDVIWHNGSGRAIPFRLWPGPSPPPELAADPLLQSSELGWLDEASEFYLPPPGVFRVLVRFPDGTFAMLAPDGMQSWFDEDGRILRIYDRHPQNQVHFSYNHRGELSEVRNDAGSWLAFGYYRAPGDFLETAPDGAALDETSSSGRAQGLIARIRDHTGRDVLYHYDDRGVLERVEGPEITVAGPEGFSGGRPETVYSNAPPTDPAVSAASWTGLVSSADPSGTALLQTTDLGSSGRDVAGAFALAGGTASLSLGQANDAAALANGTGTSTVTGVDGSQTEYRFDARGRPTNLSIAPGPGEAGAAQVEVGFTYNEHGLVETVTNAMGAVTTYTYDLDNPVLRSRGNLVGVRVVPDAARGGPTLEAEAEYDSRYNLPIRKTDFEEHTYEIDLTPDGRETESIRVVGDPSGEVESFGYNGFGQLETHTTMFGISTVWTFDPATGFVKSKTIGARTFTYEYQGDAGARGLPTVIVDPGGTATTLVYNERDQLVRREVGGFRIVRSYDEAGNEIRTASTLDADREVVERRFFDVTGFLRKHVVEQVEVDGGVQDLVTEFVPDGAGRLRRVIYPTGEIHDLFYDGLGRIVRYRIGGAGSGAYEERRTYDANGNVVRLEIGDAVTTYTYDGHDRLIREDHPEGTVIHRIYDRDARLLGYRVEDAAGNVLEDNTFEHDAHGRVEWVKRRRDDGLSQTHYAYDRSARQITMTDANGQSSTTTFDPAGQPMRVEDAISQTTYALDPHGRLESITTAEGGTTYTRSFGRDSFGNVSSIEDGLGQGVSLQVSAGGLPERRVDRRGNESTYAYTRLGEFLRTVTAAGVETRFSYDANRELRSLSDGAGHTTVHSYDGAGRLSLTVHPDGSETRYLDFDARNCPQTIEMPGGVVVSQTFDRQCRLLSRSISGPAGATHDEVYSWDALSRPLQITYPDASIAYEYDLFGPTRRVTQTQNGSTHVLTQAIDPAGFRQSVIYPSGIEVATGRDGTGRLETVLPSAGAPVVASTAFAADDLVGERVLGAGLVRKKVRYDGNRRPTAIRYERTSGGALLAEVRYAYDAGDLQEARQFLHRGGRGDLFHYDAGKRLERADLGARPGVPEEVPRSMPGFASPASAAGWSPGRYARLMSYDTTDALDGIATEDPDNTDPPPLASTFGPRDALLSPASIDGLATDPDAVGNLRQRRLFVRPPGASAPVPVAAQLSYNLLGQLVSVARSDGCTVSYRYGPHGLVTRRTVSGDPTLCRTGDSDFVWDGGNLIEIREISSGDLVARFFYGDLPGELLAAELADAGGVLRRYLPLADALGSVMALVNESGAVIERVTYDAWGQPVLEGPDPAPPRVSRVRVEGGDLVIEFSEAVLPPLEIQGAEGLESAWRPLENGLRVESGGEVVPGRFRIDESAGEVFGSAIRFEPDGSLPQLFNLQVEEGAVRDAWLRDCAAETLALGLGAPTAPVLYAGGPAAGSTAAPRLARSRVDQPFLFQGQFFDYDTGLLYMRARFYDPSAGIFLQRDPAGFEGTVNPYAGMLNDPVNHSDPTGMAGICAVFGSRSCSDLGRSLKEAGSTARATKDGLSGFLVGMAMQFVGSVLDVGTGLAQGYEIASRPRQTPQGYVDVVRGLSMIAGDLSILSGAVSGRLGWRGVQRGRALWAATGREFLADVVSSRVLKAKVSSLVRYYGGTTFQAGRHLSRQLLGKPGDAIAVGSAFATPAEIQAMANVAMGNNVVISWRVGNNYSKLRWRRFYVEQGMAQKPFSEKGKTKGDATVDSGGKDGVPPRIYVSDIDLFDVTDRSGKPIRGERLRSITAQINAEYQRITGRSNVPIQHMPQMEAFDNIGGVALGPDGRALSTDPLTPKIVNKIGHPGLVMTIRPGRPGHVRVYRSPGWAVNRHIAQGHRRAMERMVADDIDPGDDFAGSWFGFDWLD